MTDTIFFLPFLQFKTIDPKSDCCFSVADSEQCHLICLFLVQFLLLLLRTVVNINIYGQIAAERRFFSW